MHPNSAFAWTDEREMLDQIRSIGFARIFAQTAKGPRVAHVPVLVRAGPVLHFHLANGNALTSAIDGLIALAVIEGPNGYVSANWYQDRTGTVSSWNYIVVECEGPVRKLDREALIALVDDLALHLEPKVGENWTRAKMDPARFDALLGAIKPFELRIDSLRGTRKLSQNKPEDEAARLIAGMRRAGNTAIADAMEAVRR